MSDLNVTPASQWRRQTEIVQLPSGKVAELQKPDAIRMILSDGSVPDTLVQVFTDSFVLGKASNWQPRPDELPRLMSLIDTVTRACFVNPRIADNPDYDASEISLSDVDETDKFWILNWAMPGDNAQVQSFRSQQTRGIPAVANGDSLRSASKRSRRS